MNTAPARSILVVDDSPTTARLIELQLEALGYRVAGVAATADQALGMMAATGPDLVLMDINLGEGMDGIQAADRIMHAHGVPVIYVTSYSDDRTLERAKASMPFGFINKPFRENDLRVNIEIALSRRDAGTGDCRDAPRKAYSAADEGAGVSSTYLDETLDHLVTGVVILDEDLRIHYRNDSAGRILGGHSLLSARGEQLVCQGARLKADIKKRIHDRASVVFRAGDDASLHLLIFPLSRLPDDAGPTRSVLFLFATMHDPGRLEDVVRTMYKLSPMEARITARLVFNPYLAEVAGSLGITYNTARTHLKRVYQKTGTNKLPSLVQTVITGPAGLLIHYDSLSRGRRGAAGDR